MRIGGSVPADNAVIGDYSWGNPSSGALVPLNSGKGSGGRATGFPQEAGEEFVIVHDASRNAVVIDLYLASRRYDEPTTYRLTETGSVDISKKPRKGGLIDLLA